MPATLSPRRERLLLLTLAGIQFCHIVDFMIVMPLGPILMRDFGLGAHEFALLVASYSFTAAISGVLTAIFVDRFERTRLLLAPFALFTLATLACGLAPNYPTLMLARGLAGAFGGLMGALVQTMVADAIPYERRATATGFVSTAFSISTVLGVPLSLFVANWLGWRAPFMFIATLSLGAILIGMRVLPELRHHLGGERRAHPFSAMLAVLGEANHLRTLLLSALIIFSGFTVIPYITVYAVGNVGISQHDIPIIYLVGGGATLFTARLIGRLADAHGKVEVYRIVAVAALVPLVLVTHIGAVPLWAWVACTTAFFVLLSGRMVPAMAIISSAARPQLRGTFMSLNGTVQSVAMGLATMLSGFIISVDAGGNIVGYPLVGYVAIAANLLAIVFISRIVVHERAPTTGG
ncbi:MAG: MFS transporter [Rhodocyclales bacterium]|nr:MFS transporter [Rhodocyclales bacterium]